MGKIDNFSQSINWNYSPAFKTIQISTKRIPPQSSGKTSDAVSNLSGVESSPLILPSQQQQQAIRMAIGSDATDGTATQLWELRIHKCAHVDSGVNVNQLPDITVDDIVVINSVNYFVRWADITHPFIFGDMLLLYVVEDVL